MRILITGANGYIGSFLSVYLLKKGHEIISLSRDDVDVTDMIQLYAVTKKMEMDCIVHLASSNDVDCRVAPDRALMTNGIGTRNMIDVARQHDSSLIYFSTVQVYGKELKGEYYVDSPLKLIDDYALTHYVGEEYCMMMANQHGLNVSVVRPSNIFGCPMHHRIDRWTTLVPMPFCVDAYNDSKIVLRSSGKQNRDFISLDFVSRCVSKLLDEEPGGFNVYNISSEQLLDVKTVAEMVVFLAKTILDRTVELQVNGDEPTYANEFLIKNNILSPYQFQMREEMMMEIGKILMMLQKSGGKHGSY